MERWTRFMKFLEELKRKKVTKSIFLYAVVIFRYEKLKFGYKREKFWLTIFSVYSIWLKHRYG